MGCATDYKLSHIIEESCWGSMALIVALLNVSTFFYLPWPRHELFFYGTTILCFLYSYYMFFIDVPMYVDEWRTDEANHVQYLGFFEGVWYMRKCHRVVQSFEPWEDGIRWQTPYFGLMTGIGIYLGFNEFKGYIPNHHTIAITRINDKKEKVTELA
eukprot:TRINITY_DN3970_c0_g1_i1.p1 TRINITY_DN3970_c0_g1~~TRINITY_DN3970_c0_g1_i1.p1  ORF type:complete len:157 (-),score=4.88 TRINITY_DN3970_c0_g1_i1:19-489(-)